ncbi:hypothetical protein A2U01_0118830 [Trifolium medium]|uniref:Uncharacterized protein n=1 Tax=Trifolium medium TaxID=97028 RepID=A0A392WCL4_9FABA|nr:hypothetical protein [Trifolium medium]
MITAGPASRDLVPTPMRSMLRCSRLWHTRERLAL